MKNLAVVTGVAFVTVACGPSKAPSPTPGPDSLVELRATQRDMIERVLRELDAGNADVYLDQSLFSPEFVTHLPGAAEPIRGAQALRDFAASHLKALPNIKHELLDFFPGQEIVVVRLNTTWDHTVDYLGAAPTGKRIAETAIWVLRIRDEVLVEMWAEFDGYGSGVQMGICAPFSGE